MRSSAEEEQLNAQRKCQRQLIGRQWRQTLRLPPCLCCVLGLGHKAREQGRAPVAPGRLSAGVRGECLSSAWASAPTGATFRRAWTTSASSLIPTCSGERGSEQPHSNGRFGSSRPVLSPCLWRRELRHGAGDVDALHRSRSSARSVRSAARPEARWEARLRGARPAPRPAGRLAVRQGDPPVATGWGRLSPEPADGGGYLGSGPGDRFHRATTGQRPAYDSGACPQARGRPGQTGLTWAPRGYEVWSLSTRFLTFLTTSAPSTRIEG